MTCDLFDCFVRHYRSKMAREWSNGIFGCFGDCSICVVSYVCPCYVFGKNAESIGGNCCVCCISSLIPFVNYCAAILVRSRIRRQKGIMGSNLNDACCVLCCPFCVLVQSAKEVQQIPTGLYMAHE